MVTKKKAQLQKEIERWQATIVIEKAERKKHRRAIDSALQRIEKNVRAQYEVELRLKLHQDALQEAELRLGELA